MTGVTQCFLNIYVLNVYVMSRLSRKIVIFSIIFSIVMPLLNSPSMAQAQPLQITLTASTDTDQMSAEDFFKRGVYEVLSGDYPEAIADLNQAIRLNPDNAQAYTNQGLARAALGDTQGAIADFSQAIEIDPSLALAYYNRGFVRSQLQDYPGAIEDFSQAIELNPQDGDAYHCRCLIHYTLGDKQGVRADFEKATDLYLQQGKRQQYQSLLQEIKELHSSSHFLFS
ncbi:tetratricopeptide repeat protein [Trichocoleus sp. DQ-A3]|uniref:tetratricopeptide repeat protein n=1 Tax=Cyanophyceae TaxID=3028117 RepID=UPI001682BE97|nr:tetratricopeptide repeat protein [Coleofasciculus sp. FACHB-125]MBD1899101.1 tetratricopeptide repeat protein [Coleofasciculus sp. FACHB-125]